MSADLREIQPTDSSILPLIERHLTLMRASSPACSVHAMEAEELEEHVVRLFAVFDETGVGIAMGALKTVSPALGEVKSMHVRDDRRGEGLADAILVHLLDIARQLGMARVSLETGSQNVFVPARRFYQRHGFEFCGPFEGYVEDPASVFMTREL